MCCGTISDNVPVAYERLPASRVNTNLPKLQSVTATQVKESVGRYLVGKKKVVLEYLPEAMKPATEKKEEKKP